MITFAFGTPPQGASGVQQQSPTIHTPPHLVDGSVKPLNVNLQYKQLQSTVPTTVGSFASGWTAPETPSSTRRMMVPEVHINVNAQGRSTTLLPPGISMLPTPLATKPMYPSYFQPTSPLAGSPLLAGGASPLLTSPRAGRQSPLAPPQPQRATYAGTGEVFNPEDGSQKPPEATAGGLSPSMVIEKGSSPWLGASPTMVYARPLARQGNTVRSTSVISTPSVQQHTGSPSQNALRTAAFYGLVHSVKSPPSIPAHDEWIQAEPIGNYLCEASQGRKSAFPQELTSPSVLKASNVTVVPAGRKVLVCPFRSLKVTLTDPKWNLQGIEDKLMVLELSHAKEHVKLIINPKELKATISEKESVNICGVHMPLEPHSVMRCAVSLMDGTYLGSSDLDLGKMILESVQSVEGIISIGKAGNLELRALAELHSDDLGSNPSSPAIMEKKAHTALASLKEDDDQANLSDACEPAHQVGVQTGETDRLDTARSQHSECVQTSLDQPGLVQSDRGDVRPSSRAADKPGAQLVPGESLARSHLSATSYDHNKRLSDMSVEEDLIHTTGAEEEDFRSVSTEVVTDEPAIRQPEDATPTEATAGVRTSLSTFLPEPSMENREMEHLKIISTASIRKESDEREPKRKSSSFSGATFDAEHLGSESARLPALVSDHCAAYHVCSDRSDDDKTIPVDDEDSVSPTVQESAPDLDSTCPTLAQLGEGPHLVESVVPVAEESADSSAARKPSEEAPAPSGAPCAAIPMSAVMSVDNNPRPLRRTTLDPPPGETTHKSRKRHLSDDGDLGDEPASHDSPSDVGYDKDPALRHTHARTPSEIVYDKKHILTGIKEEASPHHSRPTRSSMNTSQRDNACPATDVRHGLSDQVKADASPLNRVTAPVLGISAPTNMPAGARPTEEVHPLQQEGEEEPRKEDQTFAVQSASGRRVPLGGEGLRPTKNNSSGSEAVREGESSAASSPRQTPRSPRRRAVDEETKNQNRKAYARRLQRKPARRSRVAESTEQQESSSVIGQAMAEGGPQGGCSQESTMWANYAALAGRPVEVYGSAVPLTRVSAPASGVTVASGVGLDKVSEVLVQKVSDTGGATTSSTVLSPRGGNTECGSDSGSGRRSRRRRVYRSETTYETPPTTTSGITTTTTTTKKLTFNKQVTCYSRKRPRA